MNDRELMQQALDALEIYGANAPDVDQTITALRERLAQPEQEPVCDKDPQGCWNVRCQLGKVCKHAAPRQWQGLTADEIWACNVAPAGHHVESHICVAHQNVLDFARAIEAKLRERNVQGSSN